MMIRRFLTNTAVWTAQRKGLREQESGMSLRNCSPLSRISESWTLAVALVGTADML